MQASELRSKDLKQLRTVLNELSGDYFKLKMQHGSGQLAKTHLLKEKKRAIARVNTVIAELERGNS